MSTRKRRRKSKTNSDLQQPNQQHPNKKRLINNRVMINEITSKINQSKIGYTHRAAIERKLEISLNKNMQQIIKQHFNILYINNMSFLIYPKHNANLTTTIYYTFVEKYTSSCKNKKTTSPNQIKEINVPFETTLNELESQILSCESIDIKVHTFTIDYANKSNERRFSGSFQPTTSNKTQTIINFFGTKIAKNVALLVKIINLERTNNNNLNIKSKQSSVSRVSHSEIQNDNSNENEIFKFNIQLPIETDNKWKNTNKKSDLDEVNENNIISIDNFTFDGTPFSNTNTNNTNLDDNSDVQFFLGGTNQQYDEYNEDDEENSNVIEQCDKILDKESNKELNNDTSKQNINKYENEKETN
eukprot:502340_1